MGSRTVERLLEWWHMPSWQWNRLRRRWRTRGIGLGSVVEDCGYRLLYVTEFDRKEDHLRGIDVLTGNAWSCSIYHCGIVKVSPEHVRRVYKEIPYGVLTGTDTLEDRRAISDGQRERLSPYLYLSNAWLNGEDIDLEEATRRRDEFLHGTGTA